MGSDVEIALIVMGAILLGAGLRMWYGWAKAKQDGEDFSSYRLQMSIIGMVIVSLGLFATINFSGIAVSASGIIGLIATYAVGGFLAEPSVEKFILAAADKVGIKGG
jgi:hypothetical protein